MMAKIKLWAPLVLVVSLLALPAGSGNSATSASRFSPDMAVQLLGPRSIVALATYKNYYVVVTNKTARSIRMVKLSLTPVEPVVKSGLAYKRSRSKYYAPAVTANWMLENMKPNVSRRIRLTMRFPAIPKGTRPTYAIALEAQAVGGKAFDHEYITLHYKRNGV